MKDKSINQLLDIVRADETYLHAGDEILRRFEELEKENLSYQILTDKRLKENVGLLARISELEKEVKGCETVLINTRNMSADAIDKLKKENERRCLLW